MSYFVEGNTLTEGNSNTAVITFGRLNPTTVGHVKLIEAVAREAKQRGGDFFVFLSHSQDQKKNPLSYKQKIKWARKSVPKYSKNIIETNARNLFEVLQQIYDKDYRELVIVVGADRIGEFNALATKYNGKEARHGYYNFESIEVVSAGDRDPDAEGVEGMSASKVRAAAYEGDFETFIQGVSTALSSSDTEKYYKEIRRGLGLRESFTSFREFLTEKPQGRSTFDYIMQGSLILSPKAMERAFGGKTMTDGWHSTDMGGLKDLLKIEGKRKGISVATKIKSRNLVAGLMTSGGFMVHLRGEQLYKNYADMYTDVTKEGLRVIRGKSLPEELRDIVYDVWAEAFIDGISYLQNELVKDPKEKGQADFLQLTQKLQGEIRQRGSRPTDTYRGGLTGVSIITELMQLFRPKVDDDSRNLYGYAYKEELKVVRQAMRVVVKTYVDGLESKLGKVKELFQKGVESQFPTPTQWNELIITRPQIRRVVMIQEMMPQGITQSVIKQKVLGNHKASLQQVETIDDFMEDYADQLDFTEEALFEEVTKKDLNQIEKYADKLFAKVGIDVEFTKHFLDRVNDSRNKKPISTAELIRIFRETYKKYGKLIPQLGANAQAVIKDMMTDINVPFVLNVDKKGELDLVSKTVMRKKGFKTSNQVFAFEEWIGNITKPFGKKTTSEVFKNPASRELRDIESFANNKRFRALITPRGTVYAFDEEILHDWVIKSFDLPPKSIKVIVNFNENHIVVHEFSLNALVDQIQSSKWIQRNLRGFDISNGVYSVGLVEDAYTEFRDRLKRIAGQITTE